MLVTEANECTLTQRVRHLVREHQVSGPVVSVSGVSHSETILYKKLGEALSRFAPQTGHQYAGLEEEGLALPVADILP
jgi:hypothetical protein